MAILERVASSQPDLHRRTKLLDKMTGAEAEDEHVLDLGAFPESFRQLLSAVLDG
jgi:hypothetical protein